MNDDAKVAEIADKIAVAIDGEMPELALEALESVSAYVICQAKDYQSSMNALGYFLLTVSAFVAENYSPPKGSNDVN